MSYESAHVDRVASEKVVSTGHLCQDHPEVIIEVIHSQSGDEIGSFCGPSPSARASDANIQSAEAEMVGADGLAVPGAFFRNRRHDLTEHSEALLSIFTAKQREV